MSVAKVIELTARSPESFDAALRSGIDKAADSVDDIQSVWVRDHQVLLDGGNISEYQVTIKVTFLVR